VPIFFQQQINETTRLGIWKIEENEDFFLGTVPLQREVTHPHKRLQHLAGRFLLRYLFPGFPYELIRIADTRKPYLEDEQYHFSVSHSGDYAGAIVSSEKRVGLDIERPSQKVGRIMQKFLSEKEIKDLKIENPDQEFSKEVLIRLSILWSAKEAVFKWYGLGNVDFRSDIHLSQSTDTSLNCLFQLTNQDIPIHYEIFPELSLAWLSTEK
jgi:phosphopantetheinyl transferase